MGTFDVKTILITGGAGFIGTHLCRRLIQSGYKVSVIDLIAPAAEKNLVPNVSYTQGDVRDPSLLQSLIDQADAVFHFAATVSVTACQKHPELSRDNNIGSTLSVLNAICKKTQATRSRAIPIVFSSTAALYGMIGNDGRAIQESDVPKEFLSHYAEQKYACEKLIIEYALRHNIPSTIFRFFNIVGPGQDPQSPYSGVITIFSDLARQGLALPLNDGGYQTRDFVSVHDIVTACVKVLSLAQEKWTLEPINLGTGHAVTVREVAQLIVSAWGNRSKLVSAPPRVGDVQHSKADVTRAFNLLNWKAEKSMADCLQELKQP
jgi:UDP-glucose 4-epimerase